MVRTDIAPSDPAQMQVFSVELLYILCVSLIRIERLASQLVRENIAVCRVAPRERRLGHLDVRLQSMHSDITRSGASTAPPACRRLQRPQPLPHAIREWARTRSAICTRMKLLRYVLWECRTLARVPRPRQRREGGFARVSSRARANSLDETPAHACPALLSGDRPPLLQQDCGRQEKSLRAWDSGVRPGISCSFTRLTVQRRLHHVKHALYNRPSTSSRMRRLRWLTSRMPASPIVQLSSGAT